MEATRRKVRLLSIAAIAIILFSVIISYVVGSTFRHQKEDLKVNQKEAELLKDLNVKEQIEQYFSIIGTLPTFVSLHEDVIAMNKNASKFIASVYEECYEKHKLSEIYVIERDFDGKAPPFMTYEHGDNQRSVEEVHDLESEEEEYATQIAQIKKFEDDPDLKVQISSPLKLCVDDTGIVYSVPIKNGQELVGIVSGMVPVENISKTLERADLGILSIIINEQGEFIYCSGSNTEERNWFKENIKGRHVSKLIENNNFNIEREGYFCSFRTLDIADSGEWYLATIRPSHRELASYSFAGHFNSAMIVVAGICLAGMCKVIQRKIIAEEKEISANKAKSEFLANMSHEFRTPMNAILGFTEILLDEDITEDQQMYLKLISENSNYLLQLLSDILDYSKIEARKIDIDMFRCPLEDILTKVKSIATFNNNKEIEFKINTYDDLPEFIHTDPTRLIQCLVNLTNNAMKFTETGHVHINVLTENIEGQNYIRFDVEDTGIGIPEEKQKRIFESFTQADSSTTRNYGGSGLGLTITKQLIELMNGKISLKSKSANGSVFSILLPTNPKVTVYPETTTQEKI